VPLTKKEIDQIMGIISEKFEKLNEKLKKFF
jgi:hypothetical protein